jgi:hypothetical protein
VATAQDFISTAFRKCGQMRPGYTLPAELLADGLTEFNNMFAPMATRFQITFTKSQATG